MKLFLLLFLSTCLGHVQFLYEDALITKNFLIRNAESPNGNGRMSTAGPCGGVSAWGGSGDGTTTAGQQMTGADPGETVVMKIQYNGGHKSPSNQFQVRWACGAQGSGPTESQLRDATDLATGTCTVLSCPTDGAYPCPAPQGNDFTPGYIMSCPIPVLDANKDCTFSMLDQRDWGGCLDIAVSRNYQGNEIYVLADHVGTYTFKNKDVTTTSSLFPNCCCTMKSTSNFEVTENGDDAQVSATLSFSCPNHEVMTQSNMTDFEESFTANLVLGSGGNISWIGQREIGSQLIELKLTDKNLYYTNVDPNQPMICDGYIRRDQDDTIQTADNFVAENCPSGYTLNENGEFVSIDNGDGTVVAGESDATIGAFPFIVVIVFILICAGGYVFMKQPERILANKTPSKDVENNLR